MQFQKQLVDRVKTALLKVTANYNYDITFAKIRMKRRGGLGFLRRFVKRTTAEEKFLSSLDLRGKIIYDIGAYVGLTTIFFAKKSGPSGSIVAFEPNRVNCSQFRENVRLNGIETARLIPIGIGRTHEVRDLVVRKSGPATGSMDAEIQSQILSEENFEQFRVEVDSLDSAVATYNLPYPDLIKIDNEGMEYDALLGAARVIQEASPSFYIEIHGADNARKLGNIRQVVQLFESLRYAVWHVESSNNLTAENCDTGKEGHIFCQKLDHVPRIDQLGP